MPNTDPERRKEINRNAQARKRAVTPEVVTIVSPPGMSSPAGVEMSPPVSPPVVSPPVLINPRTKKPYGPCMGHMPPWARLEYERKYRYWVGSTLDIPSMPKEQIDNLSHAVEALTTHSRRTE